MSENIINILKKDLYSIKQQEKIELIQQKIEEYFKEGQEINLNRKNEITLFLNSILLNRINEYYFYIGNDNTDNILKLYTTLYKNKKNKHDFAYKSITIYLLDQFENGRKILENNNLSFDSKSLLTSADYIFAVNKSCESFFLRKSKQYDSYNDYYEKLQKDREIIKRYKKNIEINWEDIVNKYSTIEILYLATTFDYETKPLDVKKVFNYTTTYKRMNTLFRNNLNYKVELFSEIMVNSKFFQHTLAPTKNIENALIKFFNYKDKINNSDDFANTLFKYPKFKLINFKNRIKNKEPESNLDIVTRIKKNKI